MLRLVETSYRDHCAYSMEADALHAWIVSSSETVKSLTAGIDSMSKEELEHILGKLDVIIIKNALHMYMYMSAYIRYTSGVKVWICKDVKFP